MGAQRLPCEHGQQYLVTLACEGGLPLRLVQRENHSLRRYFRAVIEEFRFHRRLGASPEELAGRVGLLAAAVIAAA